MLNLISDFNPQTQQGAMRLGIVLAAAALMFVVGGFGGLIIGVLIG